MKHLACSLTTQAAPRQRIFWNWVDQEVRRLVVGLIQMALEKLLHQHLQAAWNQRTPQRRGYRNGYRQRGLMTPHGVLTIRVPRLRDGVLDPTVIFHRYQRRIADVERVGLEAVKRDPWLLRTKVAGG